jgi:molybdopterin synthase catalytic subunit|tara:strand:- start:66 stop:536 length:471 start_codon:yes stop_codon:yes gene_type:complete
MIKIQKEDFNISIELNTLISGNVKIGGVASFIGLVRDLVSPENNVQTLQSMTLEHYPEMTEIKLKQIESQARARWPLETSLIIHRYGELKPGDQIVLVACASIHRQAAFDACNFLMDWLKTDAPFWKLEKTAKSENWVEDRNEDYLASSKWNNHKE